MLTHPTFESKSWRPRITFLAVKCARIHVWPHGLNEVMRLWRPNLSNRVTLTLKLVASLISPQPKQR